ncbi:MAG TPA: asparaginase [Polyangiaceae bacterium]|nr:asparaginase [Polyangiaceae bacterium]
MKKVLLLNMGGTLGMQGSPLSPGDYGHKLVERVPELASLAELEIRSVCNLDSSDVGPEQWSELVTAVSDRSGSEPRGIVILHGTDTMAFTAAALAFALEGLDHPVVLTGAQRPLVAHRTDARRNLVDAVELATCDIPEVSICFDGLLLRGCRAIKGDARSYHAFESPGVEPLARMGFDVDIGAHIRRPTGAFRGDGRFDSRVAVVYLTPGLEPAIVEAMLEADTPPRGLVVAAYGVGTAPRMTRALAPVVRRAIDAGTEVVVVTQRGGLIDLELYENSRALADAGAVPGGQMRIEAATVKMMQALARFPDHLSRRRWLTTDVAGELR